MPLTKAWPKAETSRIPSELKTRAQFAAKITFYCAPHRFFEKKYGLTQVHRDVLYAYHVYFSQRSSMRVLDVGCGKGRNLLYLSALGHQATGVDIDQSKLDGIASIVQREALSHVELIQTDLALENSITEAHYDLVISTMSLQFLPPQRVCPLLQKLHSVTTVAGYHLLVFPVADDAYDLPDDFTYLPSEKALYEFYQTAGWSILEYKVSSGTLHRVDHTGKSIVGRFGFLLAQKNNGGTAS